MTHPHKKEVKKVSGGTDGKPYSGIQGGDLIIRPEDITQGEK